MVFRRIRGILNKLTPEKFEKLTLDILNAGLDSTTVLKGVILLIFEKALDEPKYTSMYAQLCKRLAENAPNYEEPNKPCTFKKLLLNKCRDEFENRALLAQHYEKQASTLTNDEVDAKYMAKRKMLGNIKFIGELGKLEMLHDSILHRCCEQLLVGRKKQPIPDQAEDLECLCHLMKTCGRILDTPKAKVRMDQYFERLYQVTENEKMPTRIRFMVQDVLDLRRTRWIPRRVAGVGKTGEGPKTIQQVREDAYRDGCIYMPQASSPTNKPSSMMGNHAIFNPLEGSFFDKHKGGMDDLFGGGYSTYLGTGPGVIPSSFDVPPPGHLNGFHGGGGSGGGGGSPATGGGGNDRQERRDDRNGGQNYRSSPPHGGGHHHRGGGGGDSVDLNAPPPPPDFGDRFTANRSKDHRHRRHHEGGGGDGGYEDRRGSNENNRFGRYNRSPNTMQHDRIRNDRNGQYMKDMKDEKGGALPPRFKKMNMYDGGKKDPSDVSLRPHSAGNMLFKPKTPSLLPKSAISKTDGSSPLGENSLLGPLPHPLKESPILIKQGSLDKGRKDKNRGNKGPTREEVFTKVETILTDLWASEGSTNEAVEAWKEGEWLPTKMSQTAVTHFYKTILVRGESERELACQVLKQLVAENCLNSTHCQEALTKMLSQSSELEKGCPQIMSNLAELAAWSVTEDLMTLAELTDIGVRDYHPMLLQVLQRLLKSMGKAKLVQVFEAADLSLMEHIPVENMEALVAVLEEFHLTFLDPLLSIQQDMTRHLAASSDPGSLLRWITDNVDASFHKQSGFVLALFTVVVRHIVAETTLPAEADAASQPDKSLVEREKELLGQFRTVLQKYVRDNKELQLTAVYALQTFCHSKNFPKGMLLRLFVNFYEMDIMDEHAFLQWKEDVNDGYPGKGKALFQVNQWLTWLEEAESEEEDEEDED